MDYNDPFTTYEVIILSIFFLSEILFSIINVTLMFQILTLNNMSFVTSRPNLIVLFNLFLFVNLQFCPWVVPLCRARRYEFADR